MMEKIEWNYMTSEERRRHFFEWMILNRTETVIEYMEKFKIIDAVELREDDQCSSPDGGNCLRQIEPDDYCVKCGQDLEEE